MFIADFLTALFLAVAFVVLLVAAFGWGRRGEELAPAGILFAFLLLLFAIWAGGVWVAPVGPMVYGVAWVPFLFVGLFVFLLLLAAAAPAPRWRTRRAGTTVEPADEASRAALGFFFWLLVALLIIALIVGYSS